MKTSLVVILLLATAVIIACVAFRKKNFKEIFSKHPIINLLLTTISALATLVIIILIAHNLKH